MGREGKGEWIEYCTVHSVILTFEGTRQRSGDERETGETTVTVELRGCKEQEVRVRDHEH